MTSTSEAADSTEPIPHDNLIKAIVIGNDTIVHTKVDTVEHLSGKTQSTDESSEGEAETPVLHDGVIIAAYKLNDSVLHTKVNNNSKNLIYTAGVGLKKSLLALNKVSFTG